MASHFFHWFRRWLPDNLQKVEKGWNLWSIWWHHYSPTLQKFNSTFNTLTIVKIANIYTFKSQKSCTHSYKKYAKCGNKINGTRLHLQSYQQQSCIAMTSQNTILLHNKAKVYPSLPQGSFWCWYLLAASYWKWYLSNYDTPSYLAWLCMWCAILCCTQNVVGS